MPSMPDLLKKYRGMRDFGDTPEPAGRTRKLARGPIFVIQRHQASRLHYDFRLEMDGVLKSWAVPKGPSLNPGDKRLAVMVEDHPVSYIDFTGVIPKGNYGAGEVEIWDQGTYQPIDAKSNIISEKEALKMLESGQVKVLLDGTHLKGEFALVRLKDEKNWLLIKHRDEGATDKEYDIEKVLPVKMIKEVVRDKRQLKAAKKSASAKTASSKSAASKNVVKKKAEEEQPEQLKFTRFNPGRKLDQYIVPMLASLGDGPFDNKDWIFELKWDGYRAIAEVDKKNVKLYSRNGLSFNER